MLWESCFQYAAGCLRPAALQTGLPMAGLAVLGAQLKLAPEHQDFLWRAHIPWAVRAGSRCRPLLHLYYERHLEEDLEALRAEWRILPAPLADKPHSSGR